MLIHLQLKDTGEGIVKEQVGNTVVNMDRRQSTHSLKKDTKDVDFNLEQEDETYDVPFTRIMSLNNPEWMFNIVGCLASLLVGCTLPGFAVLFGEVYRALSLPDPEDVRQETAVFSGAFVVIGIVAGLGTFLQGEFRGSVPALVWRESGKPPSLQLAGIQTLISPPLGMTPWTMWPLNQVCAIFQMYMFGKAGVRLTTRLRVATMRAMLKQEMGWFDEDRNRVGILCARLSGDASSVQGATGTRIGTILQSASTMVIGTILGLYYSWKLALVSLVTVPLVLGGIYGESKIIHSGGLHEKEALECATKFYYCRSCVYISNNRLIMEQPSSIGEQRVFLGMKQVGRWLTNSKPRWHLPSFKQVPFPYLNHFECLKLFQIAVEAIANLRTVASLGAECLFIRLYEEQLRVAKASSQMKTKIRGLVFALGTSAPFFAYALTLYYGGVLTITEGLPYENIIK
ncbi:unnamed protein product [Timema podura]|uniref:ABC transmembrane type-1 domain-containing protein n=1 Tax=Timema podura TaxID=61482 RepID=A0ABN7NY71_TIMPD|nr:unnamed protein product [Timema podura]